MKWNVDTMSLILQRSLTWRCSKVEGKIKSEKMLLKKKIFSTSQCSACNTPLFPPTMTTFHSRAMMNTRRQRRSFGKNMMMVTLRFAWLIYKIIHKTLLKVVFSHCRSLYRHMDVLLSVVVMQFSCESSMNPLFPLCNGMTITFHILARKIDMRNFY